MPFICERKPGHAMLPMDLIAPPTMSSSSSSSYSAATAVAAASAAAPSFPHSFPSSPFSHYSPPAVASPSTLYKHHRRSGAFISEAHCRGDAYGFFPTPTPIIRPVADDGEKKSFVDQYSLQLEYLADQAAGEIKYLEEIRNSQLVGGDDVVGGGGFGGGGYRFRSEDAPGMTLRNDSGGMGDDDDDDYDSDDSGSKDIFYAPMGSKRYSLAFDDDDQDDVMMEDDDEMECDGLVKKLGHTAGNVPSFCRPDAESDEEMDVQEHEQECSRDHHPIVGAGAAQPAAAVANKRKREREEPESSMSVPASFGVALGGAGRGLGGKRIRVLENDTFNALLKGCRRQPEDIRKTRVEGMA